MFGRPMEVRKRILPSPWNPLGFFFDLKFLKQITQTQITQTNPWNGINGKVDSATLPFKVWEPPRCNSLLFHSATSLEVCPGLDLIPWIVMCSVHVCIYVYIYIYYMNVYVYYIQSCSNILLTCVPNIHSLMQDIIQDIDYFSPPCSERWSCGAWWHHRPHMLHRIQTGWDSPWFRLLKQKKLKATTIKENWATKVQQKKQLRRKWNNSDWQQAFVVFHCAPKITE